MVKLRAELQAKVWDHLTPEEQVEFNAYLADLQEEAREIGWQDGYDSGQRDARLARWV